MGPQRPIDWKRESWILAAILLCALAIRLFQLGHFPDTINYDEADNIQNAVRILHGRTPEHGIFGLDWSQHPVFSMYIRSAGVAVFGFNAPAVRLPSAILSTLALVPFYLMLRRQVSVLPAALTAILLSTEVWYLNFSRSGWINIDIVLYVLTGMLLTILAISPSRSRKAPAAATYGLFALAGVCWALALYGYTAGAAGTLALLLFAVAIIVQGHSRRRQLLLGFAVLLGVEALLFAPQAVVAVSDWNHFNTRNRVVFVANSSEFQQDSVGTMFDQLQRNLRGPWDGSVNNKPAYTPVREPQLSLLTGLLVLLGMVLAVTKREYRLAPETWFWSLILLAAWSSTQLLTVSTPDGARGLVYLPALVFFAGLSLHWVFVAVVARQIGARRGRTNAIIASAAICGGMLLGAAWNVGHYVDWQRAPATRSARYPYVTVREFTAWAADIVQRAQAGERTTNVNAWRELHPIADPGDPYDELQE